MSAARRRLLAGAGLDFTVTPSAVDEPAIRRACREAGDDGPETVQRLAQAKARDVALRSPGALVIGADQMLECDGAFFDKPADRAAAADSLAALRGKTHRLLTAAAVVRDGELVWSHFDQPGLVMRDFDDAYLNAYLDALGDTAFDVVGPYRIEGLGAGLFSRIEGDYFAILGLPLLPLLAFLRSQGVAGL